MNEFSTNPLLAGESSNLVKCGNVRSSKPYGIRFPFTFCCPRHETIWEMLRSLPFDPASTMVTKRLSLPRLLRPILPAVCVAWLRMLFTCVSNSSSSVLPLLFSNKPRCVWSISEPTSRFLLVIASVISVFVFSFAIKSPMPTLYATDFIYSVTMFCRSSINAALAMFPKSLQIR